MPRPAETQRKYSKADDLMLEQAQVMHNNLSADLAEFTALFTFINAAFVTSMQDAIDTAEAIPIGDDETGGLEILTTAVELALEECRIQYQKLITYLKLIYPNDPDPLDAFRALRYDKVRNSQTRMVDLMENAYSKADSITYSASLIAAGFTQVEINKLNTLGEALRTANIAQEDFRSNLRIKTRARISAYNGVWEIMSIVSQASKVVFINNYEKLHQYLLYPENNQGSMPSKVQHLSYNIDLARFKWDVAANALSYTLEMKRDTVGFDWTVIYSDVANEFDYTPDSGSWLFRCRGENDAGSGAWSNELRYVQP